MGNEIQKGIPHLDSNYWKDLKKTESEDSDINIINMNCQTIFNPNEVLPNSKNKHSIFEE